MKVGDLVRYRSDGEFVTRRVHEELMGLVLEVASDTGASGDWPVRVKWNARHCNLMWHPAFSLERVNDSIKGR